MSFIGRKLCNCFGKLSLILRLILGLVNYLLLSLKEFIINVDIDN